MKSPTLRLILTLLATLPILAFAPQLVAQTNKPTAAEKKATSKSHASEHKAKSIPFYGNIKTLDKAARTLSIDKRILLITADTKISQDDKPVSLEKAAVGDYITGSYHKTDDGRLIANTVYIGGKNKPKAAESKK